MKIGFSSPKLPKSGAVAVVATKGAKLGPTAEMLDKETDGALSRAIKASRFEGEKAQTLEILAPGGTSVSRIVVVGLGDASKLTDLAAQAIGGSVYAKLSHGGEKQVTFVLDDIAGVELNKAEIGAQIGYGAQLRAYRFDKYLTKQKETAKPSLLKMTVGLKETAAAKKRFAVLEKVCEGVYFARDLVSEPPNILFPGEFARRLQELKDLGVKVEVLDEKRMEKLGMGALLGVGQGSTKESKLVVMQWNGAAKSKKPVAFVGKGVCFDTGGISLKPAAGMWDMKFDMGGAAAVSGLMKALAGRKAKANVVGVVGLVENMPDGDAQRPSDIVTSMSGQTIEVLNTDAEGRLVLADALWYTQDRFKPQVMIDLATLTGAIMMSLGFEYCGLFSNDDELAKRIEESGRQTGEGAWRMPMGEAYNKGINSPVADMQNIANQPYGGSITAAEFLKRFVNDTPWAHLDIAAMAWFKEVKDNTPKGATGFGVRMLDRLVADHYE